MSDSNRRRTYGLKNLLEGMKYIGYINGSTNADKATRYVIDSSVKSIVTFIKYESSINSSNTSRLLYFSDVYYLNDLNTDKKSGTLRYNASDRTLYLVHSNNYYSGIGYVFEGEYESKLTAQ